MNHILQKYRITVLWDLIVLLNSIILHVTLSTRTTSLSLATLSSPRPTLSSIKLVLLEYARRFILSYRNDKESFFLCRRGWYRRFCLARITNRWEKENILCTCQKINEQNILPTTILSSKNNLTLTIILLNNHQEDVS